MKTILIFANEPRFSEHETDRKFNERKQALLPEIRTFIENHKLFVGKSTTITFFHTGVSSLVCLLVTDDKKYVLKIPLSILDSRLEGRFLNAWRNVGVKVPAVFEAGEIGNHYYTLMEYIDAPSVAKKYDRQQMIEKGIYREMGMTLRKMHQVKAEGFSNIVNDKSEPEYATIFSWLAGDQRTIDQIKFVKENRLLDDVEHGSIDQAIEIIVSKIGMNSESVFCHNDFNPSNIFATDPITVFDPWPCFHHPYMDLARAIVVSLIGSEQVDEQIITGYFNNEEYDRQLLQAFVLLNIYVKFKYQFETKNEDGMQKMKKYLSRKKKDL